MTVGLVEGQLEGGQVETPARLPSEITEAAQPGAAMFYGEIPFEWEATKKRSLLVLGIGNCLLRDDGAGLLLLAKIQKQSERWNDRVEFVDGGTQGLALLPYLGGRSSLVILDAVALGAKPGTVHVLTEEGLGQFSACRSTTAHEGNAGELLATAMLLGECPEHITVVGIEPAEIRTGLGLSEAVERSVPEALEVATNVIEQMLQGV